MYRIGELKKIRSDKKLDVKPFVPIDLYDCIERLSYIIRKPIKDVGELLCIYGIKSDFVLDSLSSYFVRDFSPGGANTVYVAQSSSGTRRIKIAGYKKRVSIRFKQSTYNQLYTLSYVAGLTVSSTVSLLLIHAFRDLTLLNNIIEPVGTLDENRINERRYILKKARKGAWQYESIR